MARLKELQFKVGDVVKSTKYSYLITEHVDVVKKYKLSSDAPNYVYMIKNLTTGKHYEAIPQRIHKSHKFVAHKPQLLVLFGESGV